MLSSILAVSLLLIAADDAKEEAKRLVNEGNQAFEAGDFAAALLHFQKAYEAYPSPKILVNLGETHRAREDWVQAVLHYERFLRERGPDEHMVKEVESRIAELNEKVGRIEVAAENASATVDGEAVEGPLVVVAPGEHRLVVRREGHLEFTRTVSVSAGETERVEVQLVAMAAGGAADEEAITEKWWFWTGAGVVAVAVVGVVLGIALNTGGDDFVPSGELPRASTANWEPF
jgi:hypothetical protein